MKTEFKNDGTKKLQKQLEGLYDKLQKELNESQLDTLHMIVETELELESRCNI